MTNQPPPSNLPIPDPTILTTQLVDRAISDFRELINTRIDGILKEEQTWRARLKEVERLNAVAIDKAVDTMNERLAGMNEFRATLRDQQTSFMTRAEFDAQHEVLTVKVEGIKSEMDKAEGRRVVTSAVTAIAASAIISLIIGIIIVVVSRVG